MNSSTAWTIDTTETDRGYTGQESLDSVGLDDYNARLYDPGLGRFLSVDPVIGHPESTQSINPYSYVQDNPLNKTDPTGEASTQCVGKGTNKICNVTPPKLPTPTGSHIPQKPTTVGNLVCTTTDCNSSTGVSPGGGQGTGTTNPNAKNNVPTHDVKNQKPTYADKATYGEIRSYARTKKGGSPKGLGDVKATIGAVCQRNGNCCPGYDNCKEIDGSNSTGTDKQAWKNIMNTRGSDKSKGANYMCVNTQVCGFVHQVYTHRHGKVILEERKNPLKPTVIMTLKHTAGAGGTLTLYFYDDPNKQWLTHKDYIEGWNGGAQ